MINFQEGFSCHPNHGFIANNNLESFSRKKSFKWEIFKLLFCKFLIGFWEILYSSLGVTPNCLSYFDPSSLTAFNLSGCQSKFCRPVKQQATKKKKYMTHVYPVSSYLQVPIHFLCLMEMNICLKGNKNLLSDDRPKIRKICNICASKPSPMFYAQYFVFLEIFSVKKI